mmetsp:Transcript_117388/g.328609  ORF Transcript_117388/g.328609 Transcript_117388/m.328609 type:complete len:224 (-) Transcript_117388:525-1196(-)
MPAVGGGGRSLAGAAPVAAARVGGLPLLDRALRPAGPGRRHAGPLSSLVLVARRALLAARGCRSPDLDLAGADVGSGAPRRRCLVAAGSRLVQQRTALQEQRLARAEHITAEASARPVEQGLLLGGVADLIAVCGGLSQRLSFGGGGAAPGGPAAVSGAGGRRGAAVLARGAGGAATAGGRHGFGGRVREQRGRRLREAEAEVEVEHEAVCAREGRDTVRRQR